MFFEKAFAVFLSLPVTCHLLLLWALERIIFFSSLSVSHIFLNPEEVDDYVIVSQTCPQELRSAITTVPLGPASPG